MERQNKSKKPKSIILGWLLLILFGLILLGSWKYPIGREVAIGFFLYLRSVLQLLSTMDWLVIAQGVAGIWMAIIATAALHTWKRKIKVQKHIDFIDELTEAIHAFILSMSTPVSFLKFAKIGIDSYTGIHNEPEEIKNPEAVAFIRKRGKASRENIRKHLDVVRPILSRMNSLVVKGQVFGIENYSKCQNARSMLEWSYNQIESFFSIIGSPDLNWKHPDVQQALNKVLLINPEHIENNLAEQNSEFIRFAREAYRKALK